MVKRTLTIDVPDWLYKQLERRAVDHHSTVEQESSDLLASKVLDDEREAEQYDRVLALMDSYSDEQLWEAAGGCLTPESNARGAELNDKQQAEGLTVAERVELSMLLVQYDWHLLIRGKALASLKQRGHDLGPLLVVPEPASRVE